MVTVPVSWSYYSAGSRFGRQDGILRYIIHRLGEAPGYWDVEEVRPA